MPCRDCGATHTNPRSSNLCRTCGALVSKRNLYESTKRNTVMKGLTVEHHTQWTADTVVFLGSDDVYLRLVASGEGLMPIWYILNMGSFEWVEDSFELDIAFTGRGS